VELFSAEWAVALERELTADEGYSRAAARWKGALLFVLEPTGADQQRSVFLDLVHGSARAVRPALPQDQRAASVAVAAPPEVWRRVMSGALEPGTALLGGHLRLVRGSLFSLLPHLEAARALLACARRIPLTE